MTIAAGVRLRPYEILSALGAGGMGEVYRARDTRLERIVAIKVLPDHLASHPELRQRFEREARAVSSLNHPHICTVHDIGHQDGLGYLVMELSEGESLADRLIKGPLSTDHVLRYPIQIADALDKAHRAGIVHRDLKPANIMLTKSGSKLLDFGLAKFDGGESRLISTVTSLPTERHSLTGEGTILGTFQYMAPEQMAPPALDRVIKRCLAKDPEDRWKTARDLTMELSWISEGGSQTGVPAPVAARRKSRQRRGWISAGVLALLAVVAGSVAALSRFEGDSADSYS